MKSFQVDGMIGVIYIATSALDEFMRYCGERDVPEVVSRILAYHNDHVNEVSKDAEVSGAEAALFITDVDHFDLCLIEFQSDDSPHRIMHLVNKRVSEQVVKQLTGHGIHEYKAGGSNAVH